MARHGLTLDPDPKRGQRDAVLAHLREALAIDASALARAEQVARRAGQPVEQVLNQLGGLSDENLVDAYAQACGCEIWDPTASPPLEDLAGLGVSPDFLRRSRLVPLAGPGPGLSCAAGDPLDDQALGGLAFASGRTISVLAARPADLRRAFDQLFGNAPEALPTDTRRLDREVEFLSDAGAEGGGARLVAEVFEAAIAAGASDIHFEPRRNDLRIRFRVDGRMLEHQVASLDYAGPAVSRVKVIANLDLGERRLPQDGRTTFVVQGKQVDVRVATSPTVFGEAAVLRILDRTTVPLDLDAMGLSPPTAALLRQAARAPHGIFLVTGPTGSGKTTSLYALLQTFAGSPRKVLSVEDPVEYHFEHVTQTQVAPQLGLTFAAALRSFLRQDPDVILVGEIRDPETAAVAIQAAMTGHLVLASVHANDALAVLPRLQDMGIESYQLAAGFRGAMAQRLVRRLCEGCREPAPTGEPLRRLCAAHGLAAPASTFAPAGCAKCKGTGFRGRVPICEGFLADEDLLRALVQQRPLADRADIAARAGLRSMLADGLGKVVAGETHLDEVLGALHG